MTGPEAADPPHYPADRPRAATVRSRLMLEVASALVGDGAWPQQQVRIEMRPQGAASWDTVLFASDGPDAVAGVLAGKSQFAIINPATAIRPAARRLAGNERDALAAIATIPSYDQLGLAVARSAGITTLEELAEAKLPLTVSLRGDRPNHSVHVVVEDTLAAADFSLADVEAWGGTVRYDEGLPHGLSRSAAMREGTVDAVFDEGVYNWVELAVEADLRFLNITADTLRPLAVQGYRAGVLRRERYPSLDAEVSTVDFSGFLIYTRADTDDRVVTAFCEALDSSRHRIAWQGGAELPLERMCTDAVDAPVPIPLHPAAAEVWRRRGYLPAPS